MTHALHSVDDPEFSPESSLASNCLSKASLPDMLQAPSPARFRNQEPQPSTTLTMVAS